MTYSLTSILWRSYENITANHTGYIFEYGQQAEILDENIYVIYFHGTNGDVVRAISRMTSLPYKKIFIEYPGYSHFSKSSELNEFTLYEDMKSIIDEIFTDLPDNAKIIMYGRSIGTGVMCKYIDKYKERIHGIILENPFITLEDIAYSYSWYFGKLITNFLSIQKWDLSTYHYLKHLNIPIFILAGQQDYITPISHARFIFENINSQQIQLINYKQESHCMKFLKIKKDVLEWIQSLPSIK